VLPNNVIVKEREKLSTSKSKKKKTADIANWKDSVWSRLHCINLSKDLLCICISQWHFHLAQFTVPMVCWATRTS
jgi:hypothetical protein